MRVDDLAQRGGVHGKEKRILQVRNAVTCLKTGLSDFLEKKWEE